MTLLLSWFSFQCKVFFVAVIFLFFYFQTANIQHLQKTNPHRSYNAKRLLSSSQTQIAALCNYCHRITTILSNKKHLNGEVKKVC